MQTIVATGRFALLSRGRHCAKHMPTGAWAEKDDQGNLILDRAGKWMLSTSDGFNRKKTSYITLNEQSVASGLSADGFSFR
jgi:hypothetical protein